jgi:class 3 adenylate cyclase
LGVIAEPVRKIVTAVFGDLVGSTALHEQLDPEPAARIMTAYYAAMRTVIERHGGRLEKLIGDGVLAVFGAPTSLEDDALRAVRCASAMIDELKTVSDELCQVWDVRLAMRAGVHTGELVVAAGAELVGDTMNTAARLEQAAAPNEVLIGEATWRLVRHDVQVESVRTPTLRGKVSAVRTWRLLSPMPDTDVGSATDLRSPMIGRDQVIDRLTVALDRAEADRRTHLAVVVGSPGVGKTRLLREFAARVTGRAAVISARCEEGNESLGCLSSVEILKQGLGMDSVALSGAQAGTEEQPIVIVLDDLHQASRSELGSLGRLTAETGGRAVLVVAAARRAIPDIDPAGWRRTRRRRTRFPRPRRDSRSPVEPS